MFEYKAKVIRVVDGDTLELELDLGFDTFRKEKVRLARVDTPEVYGVKKESAEYQKGQLASQFTKEWIEKTNGEIVVKTEKDKTGKYGRYIVEVFASEGDSVGENLQEAIIAAGYDKNSPLTHQD